MVGCITCFACQEASQDPNDMCDQCAWAKDEEKKCTECGQYGRVNHRGVCDFCIDPYGYSALMELVELEEAILKEQE